MNDFDYMLETKNLSVGYGGISILEKINLNVKPGEIVGILGRNGSGKSTVLRTIPGFLEEIDGDILSNGKSLLNKSALGRVKEFKIGCLPQHNRNIPNLTVRENLHLAQWNNPSWSKRAKEIEKLLSQTPFNQLATSLDESASVLSGGQDLILAIGVLILQKSELILLDEPSDGLDENNKSILIEVIRELKTKGTAIIVVEQLLRVLFALVDRVYVINNEKQCKDEYFKPGISTFDEISTSDIGIIKKIYQTHDVLMQEHSELIESLLWHTGD